MCILCLPNGTNHRAFMSKLFSPASLRGLNLRNRTGIAPMCQYSAIDGFVNDWPMAALTSAVATTKLTILLICITRSAPEAWLLYPNDADLNLYVTPLKPGKTGFSRPFWHQDAKFLYSQIQGFK